MIPRCSFLAGPGPAGNPVIYTVSRELPALGEGSVSAKYIILIRGEDRA